MQMLQPHHQVFPMTLPCSSRNKRNTRFITDAQLIVEGLPSRYTTPLLPKLCKDALQDLDKVVDPLEVRRVDDTAKLFLASTKIYKTENDRTENIYPYLCNLLGIEHSELLQISSCDHS
jgi:hypothetical protein